MKDLNIPIRDIARELARRYSTMTHEELDVLESILVPLKFSKGEMILAEDEVCLNFYYLHKGLVRQYYYKNDKEVTENLAVDGDMFFCIESLFTETPTKLMCEALEPTYVYAIPRKRLEEVALHNQNIQILYRKILEESLIKSQKHSDMVRFESAQNRYRRICKSAPQVVLRAPLVYIASFLQMTPETLSRVRSSTLID